MRICNLEHEIHTGNSTAVKQAICRLFSPSEVGSAEAFAYYAQ